MKPLETSFERIETKYLVSKTDLQDLIEDLKDYLVEDDYPTSTISNIYFDTEDFQLIQESLQDQHKKEKIRMRTYL
ncbi:VTC domain-containing protein, partial [Listeria monocytogenes]